MRYKQDFGTKPSFWSATDKTTYPVLQLSIRDIQRLTDDHHPTIESWPCLVSLLRNGDDVHQYSPRALLSERPVSVSRNCGLKDMIAIISSSTYRRGSYHLALLCFPKDIHLASLAVLQIQNRPRRRDKHQGHLDDHGVLYSVQNISLSSSADARASFSLLPPKSLKSTINKIRTVPTLLMNVLSLSHQGCRCGIQLPSKRNWTSGGIQYSYLYPFLHL